MNQKLQIRFTIDYFLITNTLLLIEQNFFFVPHHRPDGFRTIPFPAAYKL